MPVTAIETPLGARLPWFDVVRLDDEQARLTPRELTPNQPLIVAFLCCHSPYVRHIERQVGLLAKQYADRVSFLAIASNDENAYPDDGPEHLLQQSRDAGFDFPYCRDVQQRAARAFHASCTPEFFVFSAVFRLTYHGQFDASRPDNDVPVTGNDLRAAIEGSLSPEGHRELRQKPAFGCSIKWTAGHEPPYSYITSSATKTYLGA